MKKTYISPEFDIQDYLQNEFLTASLETSGTKVGYFVNDNELKDDDWGK